MSTPGACLVSVVIPVYNEAATIGDDLKTIFGSMAPSGIEFEVLVVDDGSTDGTCDAIAPYPEVRLIRHGRNLGVGAARRTGLRQARGEIVVTTDGDGTYPNHEIPRMIELMAENDMVVGARTHEAGTVRWLRTPAKAFIRGLASYLTGVRIPDLNSGLRCFRKSIAMQFVPLLPAGHSSESTITLAFLTGGYRVAFVPVDYYPRRGGRSSFRPVRDTAAYLGLVVRTVMYFDPLKFFGPVSLVLLALGAVKLARDLVVFELRVPGSTIVLLLTGVQIGALGLIADLIVKRSRSA